MGFYIETGTDHNKAQLIASTYSGSIVSLSEAQSAMNEGKGVVVVVDNGLFEAAGFAFDQNEFDAFAHDPDDLRSKKFVVISREDAEKASGYSR